MDKAIVPKSFTQSVVADLHTLHTAPSASRNMARRLDMQIL